METGLYLNHTTNYDTIYSDINFSTRKDIFTIIEDNQTRSKELKYLIKNFDTITFLIPKTLFIPYVYRSELLWFQLFGDNDVGSDDFLEIQTNKNRNDDVTYGETFTLHYKEYIVGLDSDNRLGLFFKSDLKTKKIPHTFLFEAAWDGYYCDGKKCKSIPFEKTTITNTTAKYKGNDVYRDKNCYNSC